MVGGLQSTAFAVQARASIFPLVFYERTPHVEHSAFFWFEFQRFFPKSVNV